MNNGCLFVVVIFLSFLGCAPSLIEQKPEVNQEPEVSVDAAPIKEATYTHKKISLTPMVVKPSETESEVIYHHKKISMTFSPWKKNKVVEGGS